MSKGPSSNGAGRCEIGVALKMPGCLVVWLLGWWPGSPVGCLRACSLWARLEVEGGRLPKSEAILCCWSLD
eukprot:1263637-Alexandrium_andersonii.AAC.1